MSARRISVERANGLVRLVGEPPGRYFASEACGSETFGCPQHATAFQYKDPMLREWLGVRVDTIEAARYDDLDGEAVVSIETGVVERKVGLSPREQALLDVWEDGEVEEHPSGILNYWTSSYYVFASPDHYLIQAKVVRYHWAERDPAWHEGFQTRAPQEQTQEGRCYQRKVVLGGHCQPSVV